MQLALSVNHVLTVMFQSRFVLYFLNATPFVMLMFWLFFQKLHFHDGRWLSRWMNTLPLWSWFWDLKMRFMPEVEDICSISISRRTKARQWSGLLLCLTVTYLYEIMSRARWNLWDNSSTDGSSVKFANLAKHCTEANTYSCLVFVHFLVC